jgi:hypothetical protein
MAKIHYKSSKSSVPRVKVTGIQSKDNNQTQKQVRILNPRGGHTHAQV